MYRKAVTPTTGGEASMQSFKGKESNVPKVRLMETGNGNHKAKDCSPSK